MLSNELISYLFIDYQIELLPYDFVVIAIDKPTIVKERRHYSESMAAASDVRLFKNVGSQVVQL